MIAHCLFEQSGTFKNEFRKLGIEAYDYDIMNDFGQTDFQIDLFAEIRGGYENKPSIFDGFTPDDVIMAFFPCVRFENQILLSFRGQASKQKSWNLKRKMEYDMKLMDELKAYYDLVNQLFIICLDRNLRLIMENPFSEEHFLRRYWCLSPSIIDRDRRDNGDYFKKPTQYWFLNIEPRTNFLYEPMEYHAIDCANFNGDSWRDRRMSDYEKTGAKDMKTARSMIHPFYARRFIKQYVLDETVTDENWTD